MVDDMRSFLKGLMAAADSQPFEGSRDARRCGPRLRVRHPLASNMHM